MDLSVSPRRTMPREDQRVSFSIFSSRNDASYLPDNECVRPFALDELLNHERSTAFNDRPRRFPAVRADRGPGDDS